jgi:hypothetical protein
MPVELPKAKLLKFNRNGKSIPTLAPQRDEVAEKLWAVRRNCSDATWAMLRPIYAAALEHSEHSGGTAS